MARRKVQPPDTSGPSTPALEDQADILQEVGAELDENGNLVADEEKIRELGAVDAESVIANRRTQAIVDKKRANMKVSFNSNDLLELYEGLIKTWPPNTLDITVRRLTGSPITRTVVSRPRSGVELYAAIEAIHGQHEEAEYEVKILDSALRQYRGNGRITMPDTRASTPQQGQQQPMNWYPPPAGYPTQPAPPGYPTQQAAQSPQPQQAPTVQVVPPALDLGMVTQLFGMFQNLQQQAQPQPQVQQPPSQPMMPPMPAATASPAEQIAWLQQAFKMFQQMQPAGQVPPPPPTPPPPAPVQTVASGVAETMTLLREAFAMFQQMQPPPPPPPQREPYRGPRSPYFAQEGGPSHYQSPPAPAPQPQTPAQQFREAMTVVRSAVDAVQEMNALLPSQEQSAPAAIALEDDGSPVQIVDMGPAKAVINKSDGSTRYWESFWANSDKILKWMGEQHSLIQKANADRQRQQQPRPQQLPPGYVEVGPGYQPPPGFVAVPVDPQQAFSSPLPPPPEDVPPPIRRTWDAPTIPEREG